MKGIVTVGSLCLIGWAGWSIGARASDQSLFLLLGIIFGLLPVIGVVVIVATKTSSVNVHHHHTHKIIQETQKQPAAMITAQSHYTVLDNPQRITATHGQLEVL